MKLHTLALVLAVAPAYMSVSAQLPEAPAPQTKGHHVPESTDAPSAAILQTPVPTFAVTKVAGFEVPQANTPLRLTLDDAIGIGIKNNLQMEISRQNERAVGGLKLTALNALIPSLTATAQTSTQQLNLAAMGFNPSSIEAVLPGVTINPIVKVDTTSAQLNLSQQLFNLPAYEVYRAAQPTIRAAELNLLLTRGDVVQRIATQYLKVLADVEAINNATAQQKGDLELERQADEKRKAGVGTNLDYLRARVERQQRDQELVKSTNDFDEDKIALNRLLGIPANQPIELADAIPYYEIDMLPLDEAKRVADQHRKDLLSLRQQLLATERERKAVKFERLPTVRAGGFYGVLGETRGLYHGVFSAQGSLDFPIFEEAKIRGHREIADAQLVALRQRLRGLQEDIDVQIRSAKLDVDSYRELVKVARSNVDLAREELQDTRDRYRTGVDDDLPVVQAQATLAQAQQRYVASMFQYNRAKLQLAHNVGVVESQFDDYLRR